MRALLAISLLLWALPAQAITYAAWIASYGITGADAAISADPDHDGVPNLMEYALDGMRPNVSDANHASMPYGGFLRRTSAAMGAWEWASTATPPTNGLNGKWHYGLRFTARPGVEGIRYTPQIADTSTLKRWYDGRSAIFCELYPGNVIQCTAKALGNRYKRMFMRLKVDVDSSVDGSLAGIHTHAFAAQALTVGTPTSLPRAVTSPTTSNVQVQDRMILRTTGANTVTDYTWQWSAAATNLEPVNVTRSSSNVAVIIPDESNPYRWTYVGNGTATLTLRTDTSTYTASVTTSTATGATTDVVTGFATGSLRKHITDAIDSALAGKTASTALAIFSTQDHATPSYVRNASCWGASWASALTSLSPWNSESSNTKAGTLISPRHVLFATHYLPAVGATMRFIKTDGTVVTRTLSSLSSLTQTQFAYPDLTVGKLDSDVPSGIEFARVLPDTWANYLPSLTSYFVPCVCTDQEEKLLVREVTAIPSATSPYALVQMTSSVDAQRRAFYEDIVGGDSGNPAMLVVNGQLVLLTVWTYGGSGSGTSIMAFKSAINTAMTTLGGGYTLTNADFSGFTSY